MKHLNLFVYQAGDKNFPAFLCINQDKDGGLVIAIRSAAPVSQDGYFEPGDFASIKLPPTEVRGFIHTLFESL
jgi:hypothetical protein